MAGVVDVPPPRVGKLGKWLYTQTANLEPTRREAAAHICARWDVNSPWFSFARTVRSLRHEDSEFLLGTLLLADDFAAQFEKAALTEIGSIGPFTPYDVVQCGFFKRNGHQCGKEAIPGADFCGQHGGQFLSAEDAKAISEHTSARIMDATSRAVRVLIELMDNGRSEMVRMQAATAVLDRAGIGPTSRVEFDITNAGADAAAAIRERLAQMAPAAAAIEAIQDAEVVYDVEPAQRTDPPV